MGGVPVGRRYILVMFVPVVYPPKFLFDGRFDPLKIPIIALHIAELSRSSGFIAIAI
jgi:hypothetical protein